MGRLTLNGGGTISWAGCWEQSKFVHSPLSAHDWGFNHSSRLLCRQPGFPHSDGRQPVTRPFSLKLLLLGYFLRAAGRKLRQYLRVSSAKLSTHRRFLSVSVLFMGIGSFWAPAFCHQSLVISWLIRTGLCSRPKKLPEAALNETNRRGPGK